MSAQLVILSLSTRSPGHIRATPFVYLICLWRVYGARNARARALRARHA
jgi:hypothetical protein